MKSVLILTDFSENAFRAAEYVCQLTGPLQINRIVLYHAYQTIVGGAEIPVTQDGAQLYLESMQELGLLHDRIRPMMASTMKIDLIAEDTGLQERINTLCREQSIDMITMGVAGKSGLEKLLVGTTTSQVLRVSSFPLLIVPHQALIGRVVSTIVFTTDLKDFRISVSERLREILDAFHADLHVVNVSPKEKESHFDHNNKPLEAVRNLLGPYGPQFHFLTADDLTGEILSFSAIHNASMIITVHRKHDFLWTLFHQSVSKKLAYDSHIPLLSLPDLP